MNRMKDHIVLEPGNPTIQWRIRQLLLALGMIEPNDTEYTFTHTDLVGKRVRILRKSDSKFGNYVYKYEKPYTKVPEDGVPKNYG